MKYLVTGGAGFIGINFIKYILERYVDCEIVCVDKLTYAANVKEIKMMHNAGLVKLYIADICDEKAINGIFEAQKPDVVINFAAESHVDRSIENPQLFLQTNVLGTSILLNACLKYGNIRFHQISTDEVYGDLPLEEKNLNFTESSPLKPSSPYSASKASADLLVLSYARTYGMYVTVSRSSNNYGEYQHSEKLIPTVICNAQEGNAVPVYGDGENIRDWLYVKDHCKAIDLIVQKGRKGEIYNVGGNCEMSNIELVKHILDSLKKSHSLIEFVKDRPGHDKHYAVDFSKLTDELDWTPKTDINEGIERTIVYFTKEER